MTAQDIINLLQRVKLKPFSNEKELQAQLADFFTEQQVSFKREYKLSKTENIDFLIDKIGLEIKIKGGALSVSRQLLRYLKHDEINELIIFTTKQMVLPKTLNGKNIHKVWKLIL